VGALLRWVGLPLCVGWYHNGYDRYDYYCYDYDHYIYYDYCHSYLYDNDYDYDYDMYRNSNVIVLLVYSSLESKSSWDAASQPDLLSEYIQAWRANRAGTVCPSPICSPNIFKLGEQIELGRCVPARFALRVYSSLESKSSWDGVSHTHRINQ
jgi:hypothetical protein